MQPNHNACRGCTTHLTALEIPFASLSPPFLLGQRHPLCAHLLLHPCHLPPSRRPSAIASCFALAHSLWSCRHGPCAALGKGRVHGSHRAGGARRQPRRACLSGTGAQHRAVLTVAGGAQVRAPVRAHACTRLPVRRMLGHACGSMRVRARVYLCVYCVRVCTGCPFLTLRPPDSTVCVARSPICLAYLPTHAHARTHARTHTCTHTHMHAHTHARTHTHAHTHAHARAHTLTRCMG